MCRRVLGMHVLPTLTALLLLHMFLTVQCSTSLHAYLVHSSSSSCHNVSIVFPVVIKIPPPCQRVLPPALSPAHGSLEGSSKQIALDNTLSPQHPRAVPHTLPTHSSYTTHTLLIHCQLIPHTMSYTRTCMLCSH